MIIRLSGVSVYASTVGADPRVRPEDRFVDVYRADAGVRPYRYG